MNGRARRAALTAAAAALAAWAAAAVPFHFAGPVARVVTPNGDGLNDVAVVVFCNPADSDVSGKVYTLLGSEVASFSARAQSAQSVCPAGSAANWSQRLTWDGRSNGSYVSSGVYLYRISSETKVYSGTLIVVR